MLRKDLDGLRKQIVTVETEKKRLDLELKKFQTKADIKRQSVEVKPGAIIETENDEISEVMAYEPNVTKHIKSDKKKSTDKIEKEVILHFFFFILAI